MAGLGDSGTNRDAGKTEHARLYWLRI